jgi:hypothetical protein
MTLDEYEAEMKKLAKENNLELTENAHNIARFRERTQLPMSKCPCSQNDPERYCISEKCMDDIISTNRCHCQCFQRKGK